MASPSDRNLIERLNRREALAAVGVVGLGAGAYALLRGPGAATAAPSARSAAARCVLAPEQTEGPYYIDEGLVRRDITEGKAGVPLELRLTVENASSCKPIRNATVEVWHCDARGDYSGYDAAAGSAAPTPGGPGHATPTSKTTYLRGAQKTDANGLATFQTIYPGWYQGRTTHIHIKVHAGGKVVHTGQLYFRDALNAAVSAVAPYAAHGQPDTTNASDSIYATGGSRSTAVTKRNGSGYVGLMTLGVKV